jgi:hypothetical protein
MLHSSYAAEAGVENSGKIVVAVKVLLSCIEYHHNNLYFRRRSTSNVNIKTLNNSANKQFDAKRMKIFLFWGRGKHL